MSRGVRELRDLQPDPIRQFQGWFEETQASDLLEPPMQATLALLGPILIGGIAGPIGPRIPVGSQDSHQHVRRHLDGRRGEEANR